MRISPPLKAVIVALPAAAWLMQADASLAHALALAVGAAFLAFAWIVFSPPRAAAVAPGAGCSEPPQGVAEQRIARTPSGRFARDVRCPAARPTARARRSTRR